ncbi:hypothetical protein Thimo_3091 [Thioflavicoccus mobilis 8321]|uniref:Secreted protein n=1 Tax=Thioflavicoccus mobilis 8321 TaxID=765912 RepID=L0H0M6_9GAMM|nr:hypothetical protein [Thioflavicoccus mobilis]AGA91776.1 hypothetical protein Thimo_3091 [Thioflavicoccus mobilis 8321]
MQRTTKISALGATLAIGGMLAFSGQAMADKVTAKYTGMSETDTIRYTVMLPPGGPGATEKSGSTTNGIFNFENARNTDTGTDPSGPIELFNNDQFVSFCIDLEDSIGTGNASWDVVALSAAPDAQAGPMGAEKADAIAKALTYALENSANAGSIDSTKLNDARFLTAAEKQAVQTVIWEIVHEDPDTAGYALDSGTATFTGLRSAAKTFANEILAGYENVDAMKGLVGLTSSSKQDFVAQVVPIPAAAWLFGSALFGMAGIGYRRGRKV